MRHSDDQQGLPRRCELPLPTLTAELLGPIGNRDSIVTGLYRDGTLTIVGRSVLVRPAQARSLAVVLEPAAEGHPWGPGLMRTIGSISLGSALLRAGLVDRLRVMIFPVIIGETGRKPLYDALPDIRLELVSSRTLDGRLLLLDYKPAPL